MRVYSLNLKNDGQKCCNSSTKYKLYNNNRIYIKSLTTMDPCGRIAGSCINVFIFIPCHIRIRVIMKHFIRKLSNITILLNLLTVTVNSHCCHSFFTGI